MAFREKSAWISTISVLAIYGYYFGAAIIERPEGADLAWRLAGAVVLLVIVQIVLNIVAAILSPTDARAPEDEREKLFVLKGMRNAHFVLSFGVVAAIGAALLGYDRYDLANGLLFALVVTELTKTTTQIVLYRRGA
jgi:hypothetical protein